MPIEMIAESLDGSEEIIIIDNNNYVFIDERMNFELHGSNITLTLRDFRLNTKQSRNLFLMKKVLEIGVLLIKMKYLPNYLN